MKVRIRGSACHNGIEIFRIFRDFDETLPSAGRAAVPVSVLLRLAVVSGYKSFRFDERVVNGAISEVNDLLRMSECEHAVAAFMSCVGRCRGVSFLQSLSHRGVADNA